MSNSNNSIIFNTENNKIVNDFLSVVFTDSLTTITPTTYIVFFGIFSIFFIIILYMFRDKLKDTLLKTNYELYIVLIGLNIINIIGTLIYYKLKSGTFVGESGNQGEKGDKGDNGEVLSCSLCQHNLYTVKTTSYDDICELNLLDTLKNNLKKENLITADIEFFNDNLMGVNGKENYDEVVDNYFYNMMDSLNTSFENRFFDFEQFSDGLLNDTLDTQNVLTRQILFITKFNYIPFIHNLNISLGLSEKLINMKFKRPMGKVGYFSFGDTPFGAVENFDITAYKCNGDVRLPIRMKNKAILQTISRKFVNMNNLKEENQNKKESFENEAYTIYEMIPPEDYVALGEVIYNSKLTPEKELFCCIKKSCAEKIKASNLKLICLYPAAYENNTSNLSFISIWRTRFNTFYSKVSDVDRKFIEGLTLLENFYLDSEREVNNDIYNNDGSIKKIYLTKLDEFMNNIRLPKIIFLTMILSNTIEQTKKDLFLLYNKYIGPNTFIQKTENINLLSNPNVNLTYSKLSNILIDLDNLVTDYFKTYEDEQINSIGNAKKSLRVDSILGNNTAEGISKNDKHYIYGRIKRMNEQIRNTINTMSVKIQNGETLYDLFNSVYNYGMIAKFYINDLTDTQKLLLNIVNCLIPPSVDIWIPANRCLVYEQIDKYRLDLEAKLTDKLTVYKNLISNYNILDDVEDADSNIENINNKNSNEETKEEKLIKAIGKCGTDNINKINSLTERLYEVLEQNLNHIPDYLEKINDGNFTEFTNNQLEIIYKQINNLLIYINKKCYV